VGRHVQPAAGAHQGVSRSPFVEPHGLCAVHRIHSRPAPTLKGDRLGEGVYRFRLGVDGALAPLDAGPPAGAAQGLQNPSYVVASPCGRWAPLAIPGPEPLSRV
jgi:hypothetical protein